MPEVAVEAPRALRGSTLGSQPILLEGSDVGEVLRKFALGTPGAQEALYRLDGRTRRSFAILLNGTDVRALEGESTRVRSGDRIVIVPALSGG